MRGLAQTALGLTGALLAAGCQAPTRMVTKVVNMPRVDLELEGGNRGYLTGTPPEGAELKTTREMVETTVEIPSFYKPKPGTAPTGEALTGPEASAPAEAAPASAAPESVASVDTYLVRPGDTLSSIAAKPEIYGKASAWHRIFNANRDQLKNPQHLRPGMTLKIPRGAAGKAVSPAAGDEGTTFKK